MLGKRSRILQRTSSKMQFTTEDGRETEYGDEKSKPVSGISRQMIGFNPVPRSVLMGIDNAFLKVRSPLSGMHNLLSTYGPWGKKGGECVGLGIVVALSSDQEHAFKRRTGAAFVQAVSPCIQRSPPPCEPIPIGCSSPRQDCRMRPSHDVRQLESFLTASRSRTSKHGNRPGCNATEEAAMYRHESIFSTESPSSSCSDADGFLPVADFLSVCYFCKRQLVLGRDIYMYRGDKAFCSVECRFQQIAIDERKERCHAAALNSGTSVPSSNAKRRSRGLNATAAAVA